MDPIPKGTSRRYPEVNGPVPRSINDDELRDRLAVEPRDDRRRGNQNASSHSDLASEREGEDPPLICKKCMKY